VKELK